MLLIERRYTCVCVCVFFFFFTVHLLSDNSGFCSLVHQVIYNWAVPSRKYLVILLLIELDRQTYILVLIMKSEM